MRVSNRSKILDAAIRVVDRDGITAVTFDSVAAEAEVTRGGMIYHFPSREALIEAINKQLADQWEASLVMHAGKPSEQTTALERQVAYQRASAHGATRAVLLFLLEFSNNPELAKPWDRIIENWSAPEPEDLDDIAAMSRFIARLAADGLWSYQYVSNKPLKSAVRKRVAESLIKMLTDDILPNGEVHQQ